MQIATSNPTDVGFEAQSFVIQLDLLSQRLNDE